MTVTFNPTPPPIGTNTVVPTGEVQTPPPVPNARTDAPPPPPVGDGDGDQPRLNAPTPNLDGISLPPNISSSDMIAAIAKIMVKMQQEGKTAAREDRQNALAMDQEALQRVADEIRSQAAFALAATVVSSAIAIAGSAVQIRGAVKAQGVLNGTVDVPGAAPSSGKQNPVTADAAAAQYSRTISDVHTGAGQITTQVGGIVGGVLTMLGSEQEAQKTEAQADSSKMQAAADQEKEFIQAYADMIRFVMDKLAEAQSQEAQTNRQIVTG